MSPQTNQTLFLIPMQTMTLGIQMDTRKVEKLERAVQVYKVQGPMFFQSGGTMKNIFGQEAKGTLAY